MYSAGLSVYSNLTLESLTWWTPITDNIEIIVDFVGADKRKLQLGLGAARASLSGSKKDKPQGWTSSGVGRRLDLAAWYKMPRVGGRPRQGGTENLEK
jgi:hypothetical protein